MGELEDIWTDVEEAVAESLMNSEGRASAWYLEHYFRKAELGVFRQPDRPDASALNAEMLAALKLAEDVLSRAPFSTNIWPNDMHPNTGIAQIRRAIAKAEGR